MQTHHSILRTAEDKRLFVLRILQLQDEIYLQLSESDFELIYSQVETPIYEYKQDHESPKDFIDSAFKHLSEMEGVYKKQSPLIYISIPQNVMLMLDDLDSFLGFNTNDNNIKLGIGKCLNTEKIHLFAIFVDQIQSISHIHYKI